MIVHTFILILRALSIYGRLCNKAIVSAYLFSHFAIELRKNASVCSGTPTPYEYTYNIYEYEYVDQETI